MNKRCITAYIVAAALVAACNHDADKSKTIQGGAKQLGPQMKAAAPAAVTTITNLQAPESVLYDPEQDVYFISNMMAVSSTLMTTVSYRA